MLLRERFEEIESFDFGAQFSIFSGFSLVLSDMAENETLQDLVVELRSDRYNIIALKNRIHQFLKNPQVDSQIAFDGSLASYLYCLWNADIEAGYNASQSILNTPDLWWSAKLALLVRNEYLDEQISNSLDLQSHKVEPFVFAFTGPKRPLFTSFGKSSYSLSVLVASKDMPRRFEYSRFSHPQVVTTYDSWLTAVGQLVGQKWSNPTQEFELMTADDLGK